MVLNDAINTAKNALTISQTHQGVPQGVPLPLR